MAPGMVPPGWFPPPESPPPPLDTTKPGGKFTGWLDSLGKRFSARVGSWLGTAIGAGIDAFMGVLGKSYSKKLQDFIKSMEATGEVPPELKPLLEEAKSPTGEAGASALLSMGNRIMGGVTGSFLETLLRPMRYQINRMHPTEQYGVDMALGSWLRGQISDTELDHNLKSNGFNDWHIDKLKKLLHVILPSDIVLPAWLRDKTKYQPFVDNLSKLGLDLSTIELLKEMAYQMPSVRDVVGFLAHEVFEPKMIEKYGLDDEWGEVDKTLFEKVGLREPMALNYWRDHWQHASWSQVVEMLHRGALKEQDVYDWFRLVEIPPYWRKNLTSIMYNLPGRIEVRMMAQYGLVDKAKIMDLLKKDGLAEEYVSLVADMNIVRGVRTDIQTRYIKGWLDSEGVKAEIAKLDLTPPMPDRLYQWIVTNVKPDRTQAEKDLTKAEVVKAVKLGEIGWLDGVDLIKKLGYDEDEADLILAIGIPVEAETLTDVQKMKLDTIRRQRRARSITREEEVRALVALGLSADLANAYADNDELRLAKVAGEETA